MMLFLRSLDSAPLTALCNRLVAIVFKRGWQQMIRQCFSLILVLVCLWLINPPSALAGLTDDRFDGNIFPLYAGNGSLVPPRFTLAESLKRDKPTLLVLYVDDSSDCKAYASVISQIDAFYGRAADLLAIDIDSLPVKDNYKPSEPGYYYKGLVPQTVLFNQSGEVMLNETGALPFERIDDVFREVFNLLPRSESVELRRRPINEISGELVPQ
jgi:thiol-disulfide isomerase/thioredoxin